MQVDLPDCWRRELAHALAAPSFEALSAFVDGERRAHVVYPPEELTFRAFRATPFTKVRVVLLGQDPYHGPGQAQGLCFSVPRGLPLPPSLRNIFRELAQDLAISVPDHGDLSAWAERGVLLLNTVLTVRAGEAGSHHKHGWEQLTDAAIRALDARARPVVFALWGKPAEQKRKLVDERRHRVVTAAHPSPLSAHRGFLGARPFTAIAQGLDFRT
jgi:uracil-DNA glycosylase